MANWFIGLPIDAQALPEGLLEGLPAGLRRLPPADLHITVAFLGAVDESAARAAWELAADIEEGPFRVTLGPAAAFGRPARPSAFGLELGDGREAVAALIGRWRDHLLAAAGQPPERREPRPHVTLGRPPRRAGETIRRRALEWVERFEVPPATIPLERIALYTWSKDRRERLFRIVESRTLPCRPG